MRREDGQASIEWLTVVGVVVAALILAGATATASGAQIAAVVVRQLDRALCIVAVGDCNEDRAPCVVSSDDLTDSHSVSVVIARHDSSKEVVIEHLSDGTWLVTYRHSTANGFDGGVGASASAHGLGVSVSLGGEVRASALAGNGTGETWRASSQAEAQWDALLLQVGKHPPGQPAQRYLSFDSSIGFEARGVFSNLIKGAASAHQLDTQGFRFDTATGRTTVFMRSSTTATLSASLPVKMLAASGVENSSVEYGLTVDRSGRPVDFEIVSSGSGNLDAKVTGSAGKVAGSAQIAHADKAPWEAEQHLDLTDPQNLAAASAFMKALDGGGIAAQITAVRALNARLVAGSTTQLRSYAASDDDGYGVSGHLAAGIRLGGSISHAHVTTALRSATVRGPDGVFTTRDDCVSAAQQ